MEQELRQIGPRIRQDVHECLADYSRRVRMSQSVIVELALIRLLEEAGYVIPDTHRH